MSKFLAFLAVLKELLSFWKWAKDAYNRWQDGKIQKRYQERQKKRNEIKAQMRVAIKEGDDEKLKDLLRDITELNSK